MVVGLLLCLVGVLLLIPSRDTLLGRFLKDGKVDDAMQLLEEEAGGEESNRTAALTVEAMRVSEREGWDEDSIAVLTGFLQNSDEFEHAAGAVLRRAEAIPPRVRGRVFAILIERALGDSDVELAEAMQMRLLESI